MSTGRPADWFELSGGALCLDFANTVGDRPTGAPVERLETWADLMEWSRRAGLLSAAGARRRLADADDRGHAAELTSLLRDREVVYRLFSDLAANRDPRAALEAFNARLRRVLPAMRLAAHGTRPRAAIRWEHAGPAAGADAIRGPVLWSAAELLASDRLASLRECEARDCGWLFLDESRGHRRRWCNMRVCGNREKLRRFRAVQQTMQRT